MKKGVGALEGIRETGSFCSVDHHKQLLGKEQVAKGARADGTEKQREKVDLKGNDSGVLFLKVPEGSLAAITRFYASCPCRRSPQVCVLLFPTKGVPIPATRAR